MPPVRRDAGSVEGSGERYVPSVDEAKELPISALGLSDGLISAIRTALFNPTARVERDAVGAFVKFLDPPIGEILSLSRKEWLLVDGVGESGVDKMETALREYGLFLRKRPSLNAPTQEQEALTMLRAMCRNDESVVDCLQRIVLERDFFESYASADTLDLFAEGALEDLK